MVGGEKTRKERGKRKEEQRRGIVGEEDGAGGEGESQDSCADNHKLFTFVWAQEVSKDE